MVRGKFMMFQRIGFVLCATLILTGCQNINKEELQALQYQAKQTESLQKENAKLKQERASLLQSVTQLNQQLEQEILDKQVLIEQNEQTGTIKVTMQQDILFPSGSYRIDQVGAADLLKRIAESLDGNNILSIVGHTDNLPVSEKWRGQFSDNWDLSARRAGEVARYLIWGAGFPPENIEVVGHANIEPVASNDTPEGRALNRRIELFIKK